MKKIWKSWFVNFYAWFSNLESGLSKVGFNKNNIEDEEDSDETKLKTKIEEVELQNFSFVPSKVKIPVGSSIRWTNRHAAKNDDQIKWVKCRSESASQQESPVIKANQSFTHTLQSVPNTF